MRVEYFPDSDTLSFLFAEEGNVTDGRSVDDDEDVTVLYGDDDRIIEIVVEHASRRFRLDQISARVVSGGRSAASAA